MRLSDDSCWNCVPWLQLLEKIQPPTEKLIADGFDFSQWLKPTDYVSDV